MHIEFDAFEILGKQKKIVCTLKRIYQQQMLSSNISKQVYNKTELHCVSKSDKSFWCNDDVDDDVDVIVFDASPNRFCWFITHLYECRRIFGLLVKSYPSNVHL